MKKITIITAMLWLVAMTSFAQVSDTTENVINLIDLRQDKFVETYTGYIKATCGDKIVGMNVRTNWIKKIVTLKSEKVTNISIIVFSQTFRNGKPDPTQFKKIRILLTDGMSFDFARNEVTSKKMRDDLDEIIQGIFQKSSSTPKT